MQPLQRPAAVIIESNCRRNIQKMQNKAMGMDAVFQPHFKTHQSKEVGRWFRDADVSSITVSTPEMAEYFMNDGWSDITIAFPFFRNQIDQINRLSKDCSLRLFIHDPEDIQFIDNAVSNPVSIIVEIDAGYNRSGCSMNDLTRIKSIVNESQKASFLSFHGFYAHDGGTYKVQGRKEVERVVDRDLQAFKDLKNIFPEASFCLGDTPSCSLVDNLRPASELSPGNLVFYDLMQVQIGSCTFNDIGLLVKVPIAQQKPSADECIIHGGAVHFSKERIQMNGSDTFGQPVLLRSDGAIEMIADSSLTGLSQEHGTVEGLSKLKKAYGTEDLKEIWICPVHSCLTANLFDHYVTPEGKIIEKRILS